MALGLWTEASPVGTDVQLDVTIQHRGMVASPRHGLVAQQRLNRVGVEEPTNLRGV